MRLSQRGSAILVLTRRLTAETDADAMCRIVLETAERQLDGAHGLLVNCDGAGPTFTIRARGPRARGLRHAHALNGGLNAGFGSEILGSPGATSVLLDPRFGFDAALLEDGMRAATLVPVAVGGRPQPVLLVAWPDARECQPEDLWFIENLGVHLGLALRNARLHSKLCQSRLSFREAQRELVRAQRLRALGDLASGLSHQFDNSLTSILGLADWLLLTLPADATGRSELKTIRAAAADAAELVERLRGFGRAASDPEACGLIDVVESIRQLPDLLRPRLDDDSHRRGVHYDVVMELCQVPLVRFALSDLREILLRLAANALDAMPLGGAITLRSREADGRVRLSVTDEGADHVGLGLSVCRSIAEWHGATIDIENGADRGATTTLVVPVPLGIPVTPEPGVV